MSLIPSNRYDYAVNEYLTVAEVAGYFRISRDCVYAAIKSGDLKCKMFSKRAFRIHIVDAIAWFNAEDTKQ